MISTSGGNLAIGISLLMRDGFSGPAATATASMGAMQRQAAALARSQMTMARNANLMGAAIGIGVIAKMGAFVREGAKFGYTMKYVGSLTRGTKDEMKALDVRAKMLGQTTMTTSDEVASGMRYMAMAGMTAAETLDNITAATYLSIATLTELGGKGGTADIMTNVMKGFQIESLHSARVADVLTTATSNANTNLWDLGEALKYSAATAMDLNVSLEETAAMVMMAGNAGIQGSMAGTAIENMMRYITMASGGDRGKAKIALAKLGLLPSDLKDAQGNLKSIGSIMNTISTRGQKAMLGNAEKQNIYIRLFGVRGKREASLLLRKMQDYDKFLAKLNNDSSGSSQRLAMAQMTTLEGRMKQWSDTLHNLKISFAEALEPVLKPFLWTLTKIAQIIGKIMDTSFGSFLTIMGAGWVVMKTAAFAFKAILLTIRLATGQIGTTMATTAGSTVAGYNSMTAAATRFRAAAGFGSTMMGAGMGSAARGGVKYTSKGAPYIIGAGGGARFISKDAAANRHVLGKTGGGMMNRMAGKGSKVGGMMSGGKGFGYGMLASIGLGLASNAVGTESTGGKALSGLSDVASYGMMGATIGSFIPVIGTAAGAIVGAAGGLLWNVYNQMTEAEKAIEDAKDTSKTPNTEEWREKAKLFMMLREDENARYGGARMMEERERRREVDPEYNKQSTEITINIDGWEAIKKKVDLGGAKTEFDLGID